MAALKSCQLATFSKKLATFSKKLANNWQLLRIFGQQTAVTDSKKGLYIFQGV